MQPEKKRRRAPRAIKSRTAAREPDRVQGPDVSRTPAVILEEFRSKAVAPVDGGPADAADRFMAADWWARSKSVDPDARAARLLAAKLNFIADELEDGPESKLGTIASRPTDERSQYLRRRRDFVRTLGRAAARSNRDEWVVLAALVDGIEGLASVLRATGVHAHRPQLRGCPCQDCFLDRQVGSIITDLRAVMPAVGDRVTPQMVRGAVLASVSPRKGASKWVAFLPIAKILEPGVEDAEELRKELDRLRSRARNTRR